MEISEKFQKRLIGNQGSPIGWSRDQWSRVVTWPTFWKLGQSTAQKCDVSRSPMEISKKFQKRLIGNQGSPIGWSRDHWSRVVTWPTFWKLGQSTAQKCDVSRSPMEISEKFQKRLIGNQGSPIGWSRDHWSRVVTWPTFWKLGQSTAQKMWRISVTDGDIREIPKATNRKSGVADRMVTWPLISGGHVTYFLETRSKYSTKMWHISVTDGDIREIPKATNSKSGVDDRMVTWPMISGGHVTYFLETRSRCSTKKCDVPRSLIAIYREKIRIIFFTYLDAWIFPCYISCGECNNSAIVNPK